MLPWGRLFHSSTSIYAVSAASKALFLEYCCNRNVQNKYVLAWNKKKNRYRVLNVTQAIRYYLEVLHLDSEFSPLPSDYLWE